MRLACTSPDCFHHQFLHLPSFFFLIYIEKKKKKNLLSLMITYVNTILPTSMCYYVSRINIRTTIFRRLTSKAIAHHLTCSLTMIVLNDIHWVCMCWNVLSDYDNYLIITTNNPQFAFLFLDSRTNQSHRCSTHPMTSDHLLDYLAFV